MRDIKETFSCNCGESIASWISFMPPESLYNQCYIINHVKYILFYLYLLYNINTDKYLNKSKMKIGFLYEMIVNK